MVKCTFFSSSLIIVFLKTSTLFFIFQLSIITQPTYKASSSIMLNNEKPSFQKSTVSQEYYQTKHSCSFSYINNSRICVLSYKVACNLNQIQTFKFKWVCLVRNECWKFMFRIKSCLCFYHNYINSELLHIISYELHV